MSSSQPPMADQRLCGGRDYCSRHPFCGCGGPDPLPARDASKPAEQQGLFRKFDVRRTDGADAAGCKHEGCEYLVLDLMHDRHAKVAAAAYATAVESTHPSLARDLRARYNLATPPNTDTVYEVRRVHYVAGEVLLRAVGDEGDEVPQSLESGQLVRLQPAGGT